ncbi:Helix-turn-helix [Lachnospiraceae bacterium XBB2008]|nr:Helix-turn-helix [Lachnospiraceae bacterium XBB2008]
MANNTTTSNTNSERDPREIFSANLKNFLSENGITQKELAKRLGVVDATVTEYCNSRRLPKAEILLELKRLYNISIDDILEGNFTSSAEAGSTQKKSINRESLNEYRKYVGIYYVYYFDTSRYKGRDSLPPKDSVLFGILSIYESRLNQETSAFGCAAVLGIKDRKEATILKKTLEGFNDASKILDHIDSNYASSAYLGDFELSQDNIFITLNHSNTDKALLILHHVESNKPLYSGGIGTVNSVSKGRTRYPVVQFMGVSRYPVSMSVEEIQHSLLLNYPTFIAEEETLEMIENLKALFADYKGKEQDFPEYQKFIAVRSTLERYITKSLERNMFRYGKISDQDDDEWYHAMKNASIIE